MNKNRKIAVLTAGLALAAGLGLATPANAAPAAPAHNTVVTVPNGYQVDLKTGVVTKSTLAASDLTWSTATYTGQLAVQSTGEVCASGHMYAWANWTLHNPGTTGQTEELNTGYLKNWTGRDVDVVTNRLVLNGITRERYGAPTMDSDGTYDLLASNSAAYGSYPGADYWGIGVVATTRQGCGWPQNVSGFTS